MNSAERLYRRLQEIAEAEPREQAGHRILQCCREILGATENIHFDYKRKKNPQDPKLDADDKKNLAEAVSGFANSAGGVLFWGISDKQGVEFRAISNVEEFARLLLELAPQSVDPFADGIDGFIVHTRKDDDPKSGIAILYIPESLLPPHRVTLNASPHKNLYMVRSGSSFLAATHVQLEDMFGRRPRPDLVLQHRLAPHHFSRVEGAEVEVFLGIKNRGRGVARAPLLDIEIVSSHKIHRYGIDGNRGFGLPRLPSSRDSNRNLFGGNLLTVIHTDTICEVATIIAKVNILSPTPPEGLEVNYHIAAEGMQTVNERLIIPGDELRQFAVEEYGSR